MTCEFHYNHHCLIITKYLFSRSLNDGIFTAARSGVYVDVWSVTARVWAFDLGFKID